MQVFHIELRPLRAKARNVTRGELGSPHKIRMFCVHMPFIGDCAPRCHRSSNDYPPKLITLRDIKIFFTTF